MATRGEPEKIKDIDSEYLSGKRQAYQEDMAELDDVDLEAATPGQDINWLEDVELLEEEGTPAVFDRYSNSFIRIYFDIPDLHPHLLRHPRGARERDRAQGARQAPAVGELLRHPAEGAAHEVPPARARPLGRGLEDGGYGLSPARSRGLGTAVALAASAVSRKGALRALRSAELGRVPGRPDRVSVRS
jgi:hypothetical protein